MSYFRQVELASGKQGDYDFELLDRSDGNGVQIIPLRAGFVTPTDLEIEDAKPQADADEAEIVASKASVKARPSGVAPPQLEIRLTALEAIVANLITLDA